MVKWSRGKNKRKMVQKGKKEARLCVHGQHTLIDQGRIDRSN